MTHSTSNDWWRGAVIYQIYPRSFKDSNGDGIGDLKGITEKLEYVASLGVDGVWLSPFFTSPMKDYGYDVTDYRDVDPMFGTLDDFDEMLEKAHQLGLKIIIDQVVSHTSDQHPWFIESRSSRDNPKADWYIWHAPKEDGTPPNNWLAVFGGPVWEFDMRRAQYYLHNFLVAQPDLNLHNPEVRKAVLDSMEFWLKRGVDGFRLDTTNFYLHDPQLRDNPPDPNFDPARPEPFLMQQHIYSRNRPENLEWLKEMRALTDKYEARMMVGEVGGNDGGIKLSAAYTSGGDKLHTTYNFRLLGGLCPSAHFIRKAVEDFKSEPGDGWPSWAFSNHDEPRVASRWMTAKTGSKFEHDPAMSRMAYVLLCSLKGTIFVYQGEELGLPEAQIPYDKIHDPFGKYMYPVYQGRDGCRTPMPWSGNAPDAGFGAGQEGWLPVPESHLSLTAIAQENDPDAMIHTVRAFLKWRQGQEVLIRGEIDFVETGSDDLLVFTRRHEGKELLCVFNLGDTLLEYAVADKEVMKIAGISPLAEKSADKLSLAPYGFAFLH